MEERLPVQTQMYVSTHLFLDILRLNAESIFEL